ncbi:MAG: hypothetical protein ABI896_09400 [Actinomycetota bacterium]
MSGGDSEVGSSVARGVVAAMAMSGLRKMTTGLGLVQEEPPEQIAREAVPGLLARVPPDLRAEAIELAHWAYGGLGGAAFGALPAGVRRQSWAGPAYGLATWLFFETAVSTLLGLRRTHESRPLERAAIAADHVLYGLVVAGKV